MEQGNVKKCRRRFDQQFKVDSVRLLAESGKTVSEVARNLGIGRTQLESWKKQLQGKTSPLAAFSGNGNISADKKELDELRRELARVKEEREILKKLWPCSHDGREKVCVYQRVRGTYSIPTSPVCSSGDAVHPEQKSCNGTPHLLRFTCFGVCCCSPDAVTDQYRTRHIFPEHYVLADDEVTLRTESVRVLLPFTQ